MRHVPAFVVAGCLVLTPTASSHPRAVNTGIVWATGNGWATGDGIYGANVDGTQRHRITRYKGGFPTDGYYSPTWSPNGQALAYWTAASDSCWIHVVGQTSGSRRTLALGGDCNRDPAWSPDGSQIAFAEPRGAGLALSVVSLRSGRVRHMTGPGVKQDGAPAWAPGRRTIAFERSSADGSRAAVFTVTLGGQERRLARGSAPSWSPTGKWLVFAWGGGIYRIGADGTHRMLLARVPGGPGGPEVSPDGRKILYTRGSSIWVMNVDGTGRTRILTIAGGLGDVGWRPG